MSTQVLIANILWFSFFIAMIAFKDWSPYSIIIPMLFHWKDNDTYER